MDRAANNSKGIIAWPVDVCYTEADPHITSIFKPIASAKLYP